MKTEWHYEEVTCGFCKKVSTARILFGRALDYCACGSNNLTINGLFVGPAARFPHEDA